MGIFQLFTENGVFDFQSYLSYLMVAFFAFAYHELAHAIVADRLGDPTPRAHGRITWNPFPHLDPLGFILLATLGFGWASTPVTPAYLRGNKRHSHALVALAGPMTNLIMALVFAAIYRAYFFVPFILPDWVLNFIWIGIWLNCLLATFNMLPIPPLDGFTILVSFLPEEMAARLMLLRRYGMVIFLVAFVFLPQVGFSPIAGVFDQSFSLAYLLAGA